MTSHDTISYCSIYRRYTKAHGSWGTGIGLVERFSASPRRDNNYVQGSLAECCQLGRPLREVLISLEPWRAYLPRVLRAARIALERAEVRRSIPRTSINIRIRRVEEGRVDSKHADDLSQLLAFTWDMPMAPGAKTPMPSRKNVHGRQKPKSLCTREFNLPYA